MLTPIDLSVVIPCLNEEKSIKACVEKAKRAFKENRIAGEVVVADNGSTDRSVEIAKAAGARVVVQEKKGYGNALIKGFTEARGKYLLMGDADDTYDFLDAPKFLKYLREGYDFVIGTRLKGTIHKGAMPWHHRYIGNPLLTLYLNSMYHSNISDSHCGMRGLSKAAFTRMQLKSPGMEFASEMILKALEAKLKIKEVPISYYPRKGESKLNSLRDGWRHLRFMLFYSPLPLFLAPGITLLITGLALLLLLVNGPTTVLGIPLDIHPMFVGSMLTLLGYQLILLGLYSKAMRVPYDLNIPDSPVRRFFKLVTFERGLFIGFCVFLIGFLMNLAVFTRWVANGYQNLEGIRLALFGMTLIVLGAQTMFSSLFMSILRLERKE